MINQNLLLGDEGYNIQRSLRFRSSASAYLNRTATTPTDGKKMTLSFWVKRGALSNGTSQWFFTGGPAPGCSLFGFYTDETFYFAATDNVGQGPKTSAVFRDCSAWYHIVLVADTTLATATDRQKIYVNGVLQTVTYPVGQIAQNATINFNSANVLNIGRYGSGVNSNYLDGYLAEVNFIDGQALTPSSFGQTNPATGVWQPIKYSGTYGTNGFYLNFSDNSNNTATTIGKDYSGNGNNWTPNNISVTSGATYDSMTDVPTLTSATAANYCVLNPLSTGRTVSQGNMYYAGSATGITKGTIGVSSGKWYWEFTGSDTGASAGVADITLSPTRTYLGDTINGWMYISGTTYNNNTGTGGRPTFTTGDVIGVAVDVDSGKLWFSKNGTWIASGDPATGANAVYSNLSGYTLTPASGSNTILDAGYLNCGQRPFAYTPPTGFVALNTFNLPTPTIGATASSQANDYFDATLYTGNGSSLSVTNSGSMQPDLVWIKARSSAYNNVLSDSVRGISKWLISDTTDAESNVAGYGVTAFNSNGFTVGLGTSFNNNTTTYVGWQWRASNTTAVTNTAGSITSTVSANTTAGFSIVTYTGTGANATVGHGLGVAPKFMIVKERSAVQNWAVYATAAGGADRYLSLNTTSAYTLDSTAFQSVDPTSSVFSIGTSGLTNASTQTYVAYCFAPVAGYSKFGSYTGNGSTDGPFVFTGFRPRFVMIKRTDVANNWFIFDTARDTYNAMSTVLEPNLSNADGATSAPIDCLSNGFKLRGSAAEGNASGGTYIYAAFAENPLKYSLAR